MFDFEKLGAFYLGRNFDVDESALQADYVMYDAKDLTTHAVIVGMTGSGKTGLGVTLLEEAAIDEIPALIIDPKGDMGNLLLNFPDLKPDDFRPWLDRDEAARQGMTLDEFAQQRAEFWKNGLAQWDQSPSRIGRLRDAAEVSVYTPGSDAGLQLTILKSLHAPPPEVLESSDAMRESVSTAVSGLLTLLGIDADPLRSREHILLSNIVDNAWRAGRDLDMPALIREIQTPPFDRIGILDLETIFPQKDRLSLAMTVNNILASPSFTAWAQGEPLNIQRLLYTDSGQPRLSVLSIAHLSDQERMFFVTLLLNEVVAWMRTQTGTSSLRAILYMDEVFGYLPPTANPPSKIPLLTLLKQARAYGLGLVLATQNPVDLDYKALSNAGTWFLGRLQTERDKLRVLDGLEGASSNAGVAFDRKRVEQILSSLGSRVFYLNNVHENEPVVFQTRWALSYLSGPMTRTQIQHLMQPRKDALHPRQDPVARSSRNSRQTTSNTSLPGRETPPVLTIDVKQSFVAVDRQTPRDATIIYRPALYGSGAVHFTDSKAHVDVWHDVAYLFPLEEETVVGKAPWTSEHSVPHDALQIETHPESGARYLDVPKECSRKTPWKSWASSLKAAIYRDQRLTLKYCRDLKRYSHPDDREGDFIAQIRQIAREARDLEITKLRNKYESKFQTLQNRIRKAEVRLAEEVEQANSATTSAVVSFGTSLLGALFGRKKLSSTNVSRIGSTVRSASRAADQRSDIQHAQAEVEQLQQDFAKLEQDLEKEIDNIRHKYSDEQLTITDYEVSPRKSDITVESVDLLWLPHLCEESGRLTPAFPLPEEAHSARASDQR